MATLRPNLRSFVDHDGAVILDIERDTMLTLNSTGGLIWNKLQQGMLIDQIILEVADETRTDLAIVERDIHEFLAELKSRHLVSSRMGIG
jgi:hypothetical protein